MNGGGGNTWLDRLAHDLRGPLAPLQTATYLLQREDLDPARRADLLAMLERQAHRLARMLDELDDWRRIGRGNLLGTRQESELALLLDHALVASGLAGTPVEDDGVAAGVRVDAQRMTQVLRTLLDYSLARDGVAPALALRRNDSRSSLELTLSGPPPADTEVAALFDQPQADPFDEGLGLRLPLAREIVRAHGGELSATVAGGRLVLRCELPLDQD
jgi:signal transduction histidine kinase